MAEDRIPFEEMTAGPFARLFGVPVAGFRWERNIRPVRAANRTRGGTVEGPWLVFPSPLGVEQRLRRYAPLDIPALHRKFVRSPTTESSILQFADQYGFLGHQRTGLKLSDSADNRVFVGEPFDLWSAAIQKMAGLVALWDLIQADRQAILGMFVRWVGSPQSVAIKYVHAGETLLRQASKNLPRVPEDGNAKDILRGASEVIVKERDKRGQTVGAEFETIATADSEAGRELLARWEYGDPVEPARYFVHDRVNRAMRGHVSPAVLPFRRGDLYFFPDSLLSALYVHFAMELSGRTRPAIVCKGCSRYFIPVHGRQAHCEPACRKRAYYHRNK